MPNSRSIDPVLLLNAYAQGVFPMAEDAENPEIFWVQPEKRGILPLNDFHIPRSLAKTIRRCRFEIRYNTDFAAVIDGCAETKEKRLRTWINQTIREAYTALFRMRYCHTVEAWQNGQLVGGLYGISLGTAFFGESMFSRVRDASKVCLAALVSRLRAQSFTLLDTQFITDHLQRFGAIEIEKQTYEKLLADALEGTAHFIPPEDEIKTDR